MAAKFVVLLAAAATLAGCGQKGPLYLPDKGGEVVTRPGGGQAQQPAGTQTQPAGTATQPSDTDTDEKKKDAQQNPR